jgi:hypothetical protein
MRSANPFASPAWVLILTLALLVGLSAFAFISTPAMAKKGPGSQETSEVRGDQVEAFLSTLPARFQVDGVNPDGSFYSGTAQLSFDTASLTLTVNWQIGSNAYSGSGPLENGSFIINWGDTTPAIYTVTPELALSGTWAGGAASEIMTRR